MIDVQIENDAEMVAQAAAEIACLVLNYASAEYGVATWGLAGGTAPLKAYSRLAEAYSEKIAWDKVKVLFGDERCVPLGDKLTNYEQVKPVLLDRVGLALQNVLLPLYDRDPLDVAADYERQLSLLTADEAAIPQIDLLWLGIGEDGHTLSLFPNTTQSNISLVTSLTNAPKPPPTRISLTLKALKNVHNCIAIATGSSKADIMPKVLSGDTNLPINQALSTVAYHGGKVKILLDQAAAAGIKEATHQA